MVGRVWNGAVRLQLPGGEKADLARTEGSHVERSPVAGDGDLVRKGQALDALRIGHRRATLAVIDVLVQMSRQDLRLIEDADSAFRNVPVNGRRQPDRPQIDAWTLEPRLDV